MSEYLCKKEWEWMVQEAKDGESGKQSDIGSKLWRETFLYIDSQLHSLRTRVEKLEKENKRLMNHIDWLTYRAGEAIAQAIGEELMRSGGRTGKEGE